jgi:hypothetical protein
VYISNSSEHLGVDPRNDINQPRAWSQGQGRLDIPLRKPPSANRNEQSHAQGDVGWQKLTSELDGKNSEKKSQQ